MVEAGFGLPLAWLRIGKSMKYAGAPGGRRWTVEEIPKCCIVFSVFPDSYVEGRKHIQSHAGVRFDHESSCQFNVGRNRAAESHQLPASSRTPRPPGTALRHPEWRPSKPKDLLWLVARPGPGSTGSGSAQERRSAATADAAPTLAPVADYQRGTRRPPQVAGPSSSRCIF